MHRSCLWYMVLCAVLALCIPVLGQSESTAGENTGIYRFHGNVEGAEVFIDGQLKGVIVQGILDVPVDITGTPYRTYALQKEGYYTYDGAINSVPAKGQIMHIYAIMTALPLTQYSRVHLLVSPPDAGITWDGAPAGEVPSTGILILYNVVPGKHTVTATKEGFTPLNQVVTVPGNDVVKVPLTLQPIPSGALNVESVPAGASVFLDDRLMGVTPLSLQEIPAGTHTITLSSEGFQNAQSTVEVTGGSTVMVSENLVPATPVPGSTRAGLSPIVLAGGLVIAGLLVACKKP